MVKKIKVAMWMKSNGDVVHVVPSKGTAFTLPEVQEMVGGYVERVKLPGGMVLLVNEEGLIRGLPGNKAASEAAGMPIVGDAVLLPKGMGW